MMLSLDGYKISEVAEKMGISLETAKEYKKEGKKRLSVRLRSLGLELFIPKFFFFVKIVYFFLHFDPPVFFPFLFYL